MDLNKRDLQLFWKRLRKAHEPLNLSRPLKYYSVGEYGGKSKRPHYHAILFNAQLDKIQPAWNIGQIHYGEVNGASVGYTLKYMCKPKWKPMHQNDDRLPQFSLMSKGLGAEYLTDNMKAWHKADLTERMYCNIEGGKKISMPRYYKLKLYTDEERAEIGVAALKKHKVNLQKAIDKAGGIDAYFRDNVEAIKDNWRKLRLEESTRNKL